MPLPSLEKTSDLELTNTAEPCLVDFPCTAANTTVPIHDRLPVELMIHVFSNVRPSKLSDIQLMHVCNAWRTILTATSNFWSDLLAVPGATKDLKFLRTLLQWSSPRKFGLNFIWRGPSWENSNWDKLLPSAIVGPAHTHRITHMVVPSLTSLFWYNPTGATSLLQTFKQENFSNLESLTVVGPCWTFIRRNQSMLYPHLMSEDLPRLRHLRISSRFLMPAVVVSSLTELAITPCACNPSHGIACRIPFASVLFSALKRCTALQIFSIDHCIPTDLAVRSERVLPLPALQALRVVDPIADLVTRLLNSISLSPNPDPHTKLEVAASVVSRRRRYTFSDIVPPTYRARALAAATRLQLDMRPSSWALHAFTPDGHHLLHAVLHPPVEHAQVVAGRACTLAELHTPRLLADIARAFARDAVTALVFDYRAVFPLRSEDLRRILLAFPQLTEFTLDGWSAAAAQGSSGGGGAAPAPAAGEGGSGGKLHWLLLRALHRFPAKQTTVVPCPRLQALTLGCAEGVPPADELCDRIAALVESRAGLLARKARRGPVLKSFTLVARMHSEMDAERAPREVKERRLREALQRRLDGWVEHVHVQLSMSRL